MNLVTCSEPCRYQQDGFCTRSGDAPVSCKTAGCCYFVPLSGKKPRP